MKWLLVPLTIVLSSSVARAQLQAYEYSTPSPNSMALGSFVETPVSHFSGQPNINIPLYTLSAGSAIVPIELVYHATGVRPDQHPGWVGTNWSLNAGGVITRTMNDLPDEYDNPNKTLRVAQSTFFEFQYGYNMLQIGVNGDDAGYFYNHNVLNQTDWDSPGRIEDLLGDDFDSRDTEPDIFTFNFLGFQGKFFLREDGEWHVQSNANFTIEVDATDPLLDLPTQLQGGNSSSSTYHVLIKNGQNTKTFRGFTLIGDDGTRYEFGMNTDAIEYTVPFFFQFGDEWTASSWYLTKIITTENNVIDFTYEPDDYISNMYVSFMYRERQFYHEDFWGNMDPWACESLPGSSSFGSGEVTHPFMYPKYASYMGSLIRPAYLAKIETGNQEVVLNRSTTTELRYDDEIYIKNRNLYNAVKQNTLAGYTAATIVENNGHDAKWPFLYNEAASTDPYDMLDELQWKKLDAIEIKGKNSSSGYKYTFSYNNSSSERLQLSSVTKTDLLSNVSIPPYEFEYYTDFTLPDYFEEKIDHWGFFNDNTTAFATNLRTQSFLNGMLNTMENSYHSYRSPTSQDTKARSGSLKKITYPTGGFTQFEYERHSYKKSLNDARTSVQTLSSTQNAGGLRIKKITSDPEGDGDPIIKSYHYVHGFQSGVDPSTLEPSGILGGNAQYYTEQVFTPDHCKVDEIETYYFSTQSVLPLSHNSQGTHVGYSEVAEVTENHGYTVYNYSNFASTITNGSILDFPPIASYNAVASPTEPYIDRSFMRGKLLSTKVFDADGAIVKKVNFEYELVNSSALQEARSLFLTDYSPMCYCNSNLQEEIRLFNAYSIVRYYHKHRLSKVTERLISQENALNQQVTERTYTRNDDGLVSVETIDNVSDGTSESTTFKYANDYTRHSLCCPTSTNAASFISDMQWSGIRNKPIEVTRKKDGDVIASTFFVYDHERGFGPKESYQLDLTAPLSSFAASSVNSTTPTGCSAGQFCLTGVVKNAGYRKVFDGEYGIDNKMVSKRTNDAHPTAILWDSSDELVISKATNAEASEIAFAGMETGMENWTLNVNNSNSGSIVFTGEHSRKIEATESGPEITLTDLGQTKRFKFSAWVNTPAGFGTNSGKIRIHTVLQGGSSSVYPGTCSCASLIEKLISSTNGNWQYIEGTIDLDDIHSSGGISYSTLLGLRLSIENNDGNHPLYVDDVRIHPFDAVMETYTFDPLYGVTSVLDGTNMRSTFEYDDFGRLLLIRDHDGNILEQRTYHYQQ